MSIIERLLKNTGAIMIARGIQPLFSIVLIIIIARMWNVEALGKYNTVFYLLIIFQVVCSFGLNPLLTREVAQNRHLVKKYINSGLSIAIPFSILSMLIMMGVIHIMNYEYDVAFAARVASIALIASALSECFEGILAGFERIQTIALVWILETTIRTGICIVLVYSGFGLLSVVVTYVIVRFLNPILYLIFIRKSIVRTRFDIDLEFIKNLIKKTYVFALILICATIYWRVDAVILPKMQDNVNAGLFGAAHRLFYFNQIMVVSFFTAFFPVISRLFAKEKEAFQRACKKSIQYLSIIGFAVALFVTVFSRNIILIFFPEEYLVAAPTLIVLMGAWLLFAITEVFGYALLASNNQMFDLKVNIIALVCKIFLNFILIYKFGFIGAAIATAISILIQLCVQFWYVAKYVISFNYHRIMVQGLKLGLAGSASILIVFLFRQYNLVGVFTLSLSIYVLGLFLLKIFSKEDISFLKKMFASIIHRKSALLE